MKKLILSPREIEIIRLCLEEKRTQFPAEITALLEKLEKEPEKHYFSDWHGNPQEF